MTSCPGSRAMAGSLLLVAAVVVVALLVAWLLFLVLRPAKPAVPMTAPQVVPSIQVTAADRLADAKEPRARVEALRIVAQTADDATALPAVETVLTTDANAIVRSEAARSLALIAVPATSASPVAQTAPAATSPRRTEQARRPWAPRAATTLELALRDADPTVVIAGAEALGHIALPQSAPALVACAQANRARPDGYGEAVVLACASALGRTGDAAGVDFLITELARDEDIGYDTVVVEALAAAGDPRAIDPLRRHEAALLAREPREAIARGPWQQGLAATRRAITACTMNQPPNGNTP